MLTKRHLSSFERATECVPAVACESCFLLTVADGCLRLLTVARGGWAPRSPPRRGGLWFESLDTGLAILVPPFGRSRRA